MPKVTKPTQTAKIDSPHAIYAQVIDDNAGVWEWRVLKVYQTVTKEKANARWFCGVSAPYSYGKPEMGDIYRSDVRGTLVAATPEWMERYGESRQLPTPTAYLQEFKEDV
jgi:hypothetical protein